MSWARLDDGFPDHPKVVAVSNADIGCWVKCFCTCSRYATGGFVSEAVALRHGTRGNHDALAEAGLWTRVRKGDSHTVAGRRDSGRRRLRNVTVTFPTDGYFIRDFLQYHFTRDEIEGGGPRASAAPLEESATVAPLEARATRAPLEAPPEVQQSPNPTQPSTIPPNPPSGSEAAPLEAAPRSRPVATRPTPDPAQPSAARTGVGSTEADPDRVRAVAARLTDIGWRTKTRADRGEGAWLRNVEQLVRERDVDVEAVDRVWAKAQKGGKDPVAMFDKMIHVWRDVLADEDQAKRHAEAKARAKIEQRAAARDIHHGVNGNAKSVRDVLDRPSGDINGLGGLQ